MINMKIPKFKEELGPRNITIGRSLDLFHSLDGYTAKCKSTSEMDDQEKQDEVIRRLKTRPCVWSNRDWELDSLVSDMIRAELDKEIMLFLTRAGGTQ
jgi:hypothetical protein